MPIGKCFDKLAKHKLFSYVLNYKLYGNTFPVFLLGEFILNFWTKCVKIKKNKNHFYIII